jgi:hypothetical protein
LLLLGTASGMNADVSTIRPGWSNEDGPDDFSETGSRGWPQGCCDDALHSVYDIIAISLGAGNSWSCQSAYQCTKRTTILILQDFSFYRFPGENLLLTQETYPFFRFLSPPADRIINRCRVSKKLHGIQ